MTQEDKSLLLKDLSARLPYRVKVEIVSYGQEDEKPWVGTLYCTDLDCFISDIAYSSIKPYLRPMSSMTEKEFLYFMSIRGMNLKSHEIQKMMSENFSHPNGMAIVNTLGRYSHNIDWLNENMFDYRGLIGKDLALEAPEGMYNNTYKE